MKRSFSELNTTALFNLGNEDLLKANAQNLFTFIWATEERIALEIDSVKVVLEPDQILSLTPFHNLQYVNGSKAIVFQFNRDFYCIKDHDKEVGCAGLLFYGNKHLPVVSLDTSEREKYKQLYQVFVDELDTDDNVQAEMLRILMTRFIIKTTRLIKAQTSITNITADKQELIRQFSFLVEVHFKNEHSVSFYASQLHKSPKTISNYFSKHDRSPLQLVHDRIVLEAKRLLMYSDKSAKEIAYEIGFDDPSHLSRLFKKQTGTSPSSFRKQQLSQ